MFHSFVDQMVMKNFIEKKRHDFPECLCPSSLPPAQYRIELVQLLPNSRSKSFVLFGTLLIIDQMIWSNSKLYWVKQGAVTIAKQSNIKINLNMISKPHTSFP